MVAVEDDRTAAGDIADGPSNPIDKDTFHDGHASEINDGLDINRWALTSKREEPPGSISSEFVTHVSIYWGHAVSCQLPVGRQRGTAAQVGQELHLPHGPPLRCDALR